MTFPWRGTQDGRLRACSHDGLSAKLVKPPKKNAQLCLVVFIFELCFVYRSKEALAELSEKLLSTCEHALMHALKGGLDHYSRISEASSSNLLS